MDAMTTLSDAERLRQQIYETIDTAVSEVDRLEQSWVRLGRHLSTFKAREAWRPLGYKTFDDFVGEVKKRARRGRTQIYGYMGAVEKLLPTISATSLEEMGVSKALELKRAVDKLDGKPLPAGLLEAALDRDVTGKELRGEIGKALNLAPDDKGTWFDLDGFFITPEERAEFKEAVKATETLLNLSKSVPDHVRRKAVIMSWMQEWYGTHAAEVNGPEDPEDR